jgi:uncharacterized pyridoxamine 5'-phosphate oxidase family protein
MNTAFEYLKENKIFHLATVDGQKARVRPFGFVMSRNKKIYFCTNNTKEVYKQMVKNPDVEISAMSADGSTWLRLSGKAVVDNSRETKVQAFSEAPFLLTLYPKGADDETYVTFYLDGAKATLYSFTGAPANLPVL